MSNRNPDSVPDACLKRRGAWLRKLIGERDDIEEVCEENDEGYCAYCHSRIVHGGLF